MKKTLAFFIFFISLFSFGQILPEGFVYLSDIDKTIQKELRYLSDNNFIGKPIDGYHKNCIIVTKASADALTKVQKSLQKEGFSLKIFDSYRPQQAVNHFVRWAKVLDDTLMKKAYYPDVPKSELFKRGYIASRSGHSRGSTVDLTIVDIKTGKELDMGSPFDFFGIKSHYLPKNITPEQQKNRLLLRNLMSKNNFRPYKNEWWHFTLRNEPFPKTYFNFPIE
ncbi:M15 family metallopeptidase [Polaribacter sp. HaHaR_3_91]|uniref:M15 family metallopeptidase n=1 Tax=Polaribacter sp. HaHaR_3_91 TaxID=2745561 RepID=UPI001C4F06FD|nr:M15 family metallopeptidase [Polaribacter sp. HaHaR_3_91]QXP64557.1 M15 family metallopeptidase [Polaribacter sp. HaHaR_3_91]